MHIRYDLSEILFYVGAIAVLLLLAFLAPHRGGRAFRPVERWLARIARRRWLAIITVGLVSLAIVVGLTLTAGIPDPGVHDEFSYLLAADTFVHGRLTNPPHPLWMHFESFHIIQQPTYASKYPPGQGMVLALGQLLGHPIVGVWLSTALACAAVCWMLMAWLPSRWALVGGLLAVVHPEVLIWSHRYFGGAVALGGGALALGGLIRVLRQPKARHALVMAVGLAVVLNSRQYEGGVLTVILLGTLCVVKRNDVAWPVIINKIALPVVAVLTATAAWLGYFNWRVTADPFRIPYQVYRASYMAAPIFIWQRAGPEPMYHHKEMRAFHTGWELHGYTKQQTAGGLCVGIASRLWTLVQKSLRLWFVIIPFLALRWALKTDKWLRLALWICVPFTVGLMLVYWTNFHYAAPVFGLFFAFVVQSMRSLRLWRPRAKPVGLFLARGTLILCAVSVVHTFAILSRHSPDAWNAQRAQLLDRLQHDGGRHLIVVRYAPQHSPHDEWVYNEADIDAAKVVWAREMDAAHNRELLDYYKDRQIWLLEPDVSPVRLIAYPAANGG